MKLRKKTIIICTVLFCGTGIFYSQAGLFSVFKGGNVIDVAKIIQQKILDSKLGKMVEAQQQIAKLEHEKMVFMSNLKGVIDEVKGISSHGLFTTAKTTKKEVFDLSQVGLNNELPTMTTLEKKKDEGRQRLEDQYVKNVTMANEYTDFSGKMQEKIDQILSDHAAGVISEKQKNTLIQALIVQAKNANTLLETESYMTEQMTDAQAKREKAIAGYIRRSNEMVLTDGKAPHIQEQRNANRITELPR